jgi:catalase
MLVQLAADGDKLDDPSIAWPETRPTIEVGVIEINSVAADSNAEQRARPPSPDGDFLNASRSGLI